VIVSWWSVRSPSRARLLSSQEKASPREAVTGWPPSDWEICAAQSGGTFATDKQVLPGLALLLLLSTSRFPLSASFTNSGKLRWALPKNLTASFFALPRIGGSREGRKHWWVQNAGLKLVVGKINFRAKKIGGSRKVNWWVRNFCPETLY
jgi:hypothetical protein